MNDTKQNPPRKPYQKPRLEQVRLVPEEAVLASCKYIGYTGAASGTSNNNCNSSVGVPCLDYGS